MIAGLVCARAGSTGLPGKNFKLMCGRPLIDWTIDAALGCGMLDRVVVVSDTVYRHPDADFLLEPKHLAEGYIGKWDVWKWAARELDAEYIVDLDISRPLKRTEHIEIIIRRFFAPPPDCHVVMGTTIARKSPYFDLLEHDGKGRLHLSKPHKFSVRQASMPVWEHAGVYVVMRSALEEYDGLFADGLVVRGKNLPAECGLDIDDEMGWIHVEAMMRRRLFEGMNLEMAVRHET